MAKQIKTPASRKKVPAASRICFLVVTVVAGSAKGSFLGIVFLVFFVVAIKVGTQRYNITEVIALLPVVT